MLRTHRHTTGLRQNYEGYVTGFVPASGPKTKSVKVPLRSVVCADCKAPIGEPCISLITNNIMPGVHICRRRLATRKYNEERGL